MSIAEDIIEGFQCSGCGVCFKKEHGHPVYCNDCFKNKPKGDPTPKARHREL